MSYGIEAAKRRAEEKKRKEQEKARKQVEVALKLHNQNKSGHVNKSSKRKMPVVEWTPDLTKQSKFTIDWSDNLTVNSSNGLLERITTDKGVRSGILKMPPGTGKTAVIVRTLGKLQKEKGHLKIALVMPPNVYKQKSWHETVKSYNNTHEDNQLDIIVITSQDKFTNLIEHPEGYDLLVNEHGLNDENSVVVIDEIHNFKNPTSKRSKQLQRLPKQVLRLGLSGTPITNDEIIDGSSYLIMADFYNNKSDFLRKHNLTHAFDDYYRLMIYDFKTKKVRPELYPKYPTFLSELGQVIFTPPIVRDIKPEDVGMPSLHETTLMLEHNKSMVEDLASLAKAFKKRMFDSQTDLYIEIVRRIHEDDERLDMLMEIINDPHVKQPLVFYQNRLVRDTIIERFKQEGIPIRIKDGEHDITEKDKDDLSPILLQYQSAAEAIEFKNSNTSVIYQHQFSANVLEQARKRNVRRYMNHDDDIQLYYIVADNAIDQNFYSTPLLRERANNETGEILNALNDVKSETEMMNRAIELLQEL